MKKMSIMVTAVTVVAVASLGANAYFYTTNQDIKSSNTNLTKQISALSEEKTILEDDNIALNSNVESLTTQLENFQSELDVLKLEITTLKDLAEKEIIPVVSEPKSVPITPEPEPSPEYNDIDNFYPGPEGHKPGYIYVPGFGYLKDEKGGSKQGTGGCYIEDLSGIQIGNMG